MAKGRGLGVGLWGGLGGREARGEVEVLPPAGRGRRVTWREAVALCRQEPVGIWSQDSRAGPRLGTSFSSSFQRPRPGSGLQDAGRPCNLGPWLFDGDLLATLLCLGHPHLLTSSLRSPE